MTDQTSTVTETVKLLRRRAAGFMARDMSIFNGRIIAEELKEIAREVEAMAARSSDHAQCPAVPDGYVLMPREATRAMTMAACDSLPSCEHVFGHAGEMLRNCYRKMVAVADTSTDRCANCTPDNCAYIKGGYGRCQSITSPIREAGK